MKKIQESLDKLRKDPTDIPDNLCVLPWISTYISPRNTIHPCCVALTTKPLGSADGLKNLQEIVNVPAYKKLRQDMLEGKRPELCNDCYLREDSSQTSVRQEWESHTRSKSAYKNVMNDAFANTEVDGTLHNFKLRQLEYRQSNLCNYKCRFCNPNSSNKWFKEWYAMGRDLETEERYDLRTGITKASVVWSEMDLQYLIDIHLAGGEPTVVDETYDMLHLLIEKGYNKNIDIGIVSNTSKLDYKNNDLLGLLSDFKFVNWSASIDGIGSAHDYLRSGGLNDWDTVESNILKLKEWTNASDRRRLRFHTTINWNNAFHFYNIYERFLVQEEIDVQTFFSSGPNGTGLNHLPNKQLQQIIDFYRSKNTSSKMIDRIINFCESHITADPKEIELREKYMQLYKWETTWLDRSRNQNFLDVFPEWEEFWNSIPLIDSKEHPEAIMI